MKRIHAFNIITVFLLYFISNLTFANKLPTSCYNEEVSSYICMGENLDLSFLLDVVESNTIKDTALLACCYHQIGLILFKNRNYLKAIEFNNLAADLRMKNNDGMYWKSIRNIGICYSKLYQYKRATKFFELAINSYKNKEPDYEANILRYFAEALTEIGEYDRAKMVTKQALKINMSENERAKTHKRLSQILIAAEDSLYYNDAIYHAQQAIEKSRIETTKAEAYNDLAIAYGVKRAFEQAIEYYEKYLLFAELNGNKKKQAIAFNNLATVNNNLGNYRTSIKLLNKSLILKKQYLCNQEFDFSYAGSFRNLANNYKDSGSLDSAFFFYQKSLINLSTQFRKKDIFKNPQLNDSSFIYSKPDLIEVLDLKAIAIFEYYNTNCDEKYLNLAENTYQTLLDFHSQLQQDISTENSRLLQANKIVPYIEQALEIAYTKQLNYNLDAKATFRLIEKNKATVLLQSMNEHDALQFTNLPDGLVEQEKDLKIAIAFYDRRLNEAKSKSLSSEKETKDVYNKISKLENRLFENKENYHQLIKNLEDNYLDYYQFKYQQKETSLAEVQYQLDEQTALIEYFVGFKHFYIFSIQKNKTKLYKIEKPNDWDEKINDFVGIFNGSNLNDDLHNSTEVYRFIEQATFFYERLLQLPLADLDENITHLQIIPDAELNYIPFDVLFYEKLDITTNLNFGDLPFLIKQKAIGYAYSANLWLDNLTTGPLQNPVVYGGYASQHSYEEEDADLPIARKQVQGIAELFKGKSYLADTATKSSFLNDNNAYNILHFAMHGKVNDTLPLNSHLVFTKTDSLNKLYAADLYNTKLQTDLAVLGACNTGTGKVQKGEGIMSLSRAFTYAGCPSLVMSLWSIPDVSSAKVLDGFFTNLKNGLSKDVALQQAKLNFLETSEKSHPLYWAGLVAVGNLEPLNLNMTMQHNRLSIIFVCLFVGVLIFITERYFLI